MDVDQWLDKFHSEFLLLLPNQNNAKTTRTILHSYQKFLPLTLVIGFLHIFENIRSIRLNKRFNAGRSCS